MAHTANVKLHTVAISSDVTTGLSAALPPELLVAVLKLLPPNEVALSARRTCKTAAQQSLTQERHRTASLGQPLPPHAVSSPLDEEAQEAFHGLTLYRKLRTVPVAAASGCVANVETAWRLLQPCLFPEQRLHYVKYMCVHTDTSDVDCAGSAAVGARNIQVLSWLLKNCPMLVYPPSTALVAARHCGLQQLQEVSHALKQSDIVTCSGSSALRGVDKCMVEGVASLPAGTPDAVAKLEWVLQVSTYPLGADTAAWAAGSGDLARLRWLRERGCPFDSPKVLEAALRGAADIAAVEWLVGEAGAPMDPADPRVVVVAASGGSVAKLRWLQARGVSLWPPPPHEDRVLREAAAHGHIETVDFLRSEAPGTQRPLGSSVLLSAVEEGHVDMAAHLQSAGCTVDGASACSTWARGGCKAGLRMWRWLLEGARLTVTADAVLYLVGRMPKRSGAQIQELLEAVRLVAHHPSSRGLDLGVAAEGRGGGDLRLLRYLHEELGWRVTPRVLVAAARGGSEAVFGWLLEHGAGQGAGHGAAQGADQAAGHAQGPGTQDDFDDCYRAAAEARNLGMLECMRRLGVPWDEGLLRDAAEGRLKAPVVEWLRQQGAQV